LVGVGIGAPWCDQKALAGRDCHCGWY